MLAGISEVLSRLGDAFSGRRCVTAWLGYGEPLFLGLGDDILPERGADGHRSRAPFRLATNFSDWSVKEGGDFVSIESERPDAERALKALIGQRVINWELGEDRSLTVIFESHSELRVDPWPPQGRISFAWSLSGQDGKVIAASTDGRYVIADDRIPTGDWFP